jgi:high-affinity iron transporter
LLSALTVAKQARGKKYVYAGVGAGLVASIAGAIALQQLFPTLTSASNREMLEGIIGIVAVVLMVGIGAWLHSKSSVKTWNAFIKRHMGEVLTTGSFIGLFGLSFLSVFREGAETILFYVGILPNISMSNFLLGIGMALAILVVVAYIMLKTSVKLPIPTLFKVLTWVIYFLGFKILGVSLSALQLTGYLSRTVVPSIPAIEVIGFYPTLQTIAAQLVYIAAIVALQLWMKRGERAALTTI